MCGIIAGFNTTPKGKGKNKGKTEKINNFIVDQYQDQCNRGTKGFGIIRIAENGKIELDRATEEIKFLLDLYLKPAKMIIAHHRQPTSSDNKLNQTHPIFISNKILNFDYYFIHNGIISNDIKLKAKHYEMGFKYSTEYQKEGYYNGSPTTTKFNDSEALGVEVALFIENKQTYVETTNTAAFMALQVNKKTQRAEKVFFGRSGTSSCLNLSKLKGNIKISSEGEGEEVIPDTLWSFDPKDPKMKLTSRGMEFKEIKDETTPEVTHYGRHIHQNPLPVGTVDKAIEGTKLTEKVPATNGGELVVIEERTWRKNKTDESITEVDYDDEEDIFVDKNYQVEMIQELKETIKEDDSDMVEMSLDTALDDQVDRIGKMMGNFQKIIQQRKIDPKERGFYLSQTYIVLKTMEAMADLVEEDYNEKLIQEEIKKEEDGDPYNVHGMGFQAGRRVHDNRSYAEDAMPGDLDFSRFG